MHAVVESQVSKSAKPFDCAQGRLWGTPRLGGFKD